MASSAKKRTRGSKASSKRKRKHSGSEDEEPAFLSSKYAEPPTSKIYNSRFHHKDPAELFRKDLISAMKLPDSEILTPDDYWLIADPWRSEWEKGVQVPVNPDALPEPAVRILRKKSKECTFKLPKKFIRFTRNNFFNPEIHVMSYTNTLAERTCRYDMDDVDLQWLTLVNEDREDFGLQPLEENVFEQIIEEFEVQAYTNFQEVIKSEDGLGVEYDEDAICDICRSPDSVEGNEMVFCDSCNICVHQICYGITKIPEGSWLCRTCALGIRPACVLCPNRGGAMKTTRCGQNWAHVGCAVWIPEVSFLNFVKMEPITKISHVPSSRWALVCSVCKEKVGACIQCSEKNCKVAFHVTCAFQEGLQMRASVKLTNTDDDKLQAFCQKHSKKIRGCFSDSSEDENLFSVKKQILTSEERANLRQQKIQAKEAEFYNYVNIDDVAEMFEIDKTDIEIIYNYWKIKRRANWNRALLPPKINNENNADEENSPFSFLKKMVHQRQDLERVRNLCYMAMKREKLSVQWIIHKQRIFEKQAEIITNKFSEVNEEEMTAVLNANFGDMAYDKKHTGLNGPSPNVVSVLTALSGEEYVKTHLNGAMKSTRKSDRIKSERTPNPYAKHYLNGLAIRSQKYLNKPKKVSSLQSCFDVKTNLSCSSQNSTDHLTSDDGCDSSKDLPDLHLNSTFISQSDSKLECFSANDNAIINLESYHINDLDVKQEDCNSEESKIGNKICFSDIPTFSQSSNDSTFDPSVNISTLSLDELVLGPKFKAEFLSNGCVSNTYESKSCNGLENEIQDFGSIKELSPIKQNSSNKVFISQKKSLNNKLNSIILNSEDVSNLSNSEQPLNCPSDFEEIKFNLELPVENCIDVTVNAISSIEIAENSSKKISPNLKTKMNKIIDFHNDDKLNSPVHCVIVKSEIPVSHSKIESASRKTRTVKLLESCDKLVKCESSDFLENNKITADKSCTNPAVSVKEKDIKIRPSSNKGSPLRTQSPTYKSTENGVIKNNKSKQNFKKLQALAKSKSKSSTNFHSASSLVNKSHSSSVNKCQEKNSSAVNKTDESDQPEVKESSTVSGTAPGQQNIFRGYKIPKKTRTEKPEENSLDLKRGNIPLSPLPDITSTSLSGYQTKGPSWRKLEPRTKDVSSCNPRINMNGNFQQQPSERIIIKLQKDTSDPESQRWNHPDLNNNSFTRNMNNWMGALPPPPPPPPQLLQSHPLPPFIPHHPSRPWHRMRSRGGFQQIHMGYSNGPYT